MNIHSMVKSKYQIRYLRILQEIFYWTKATRNNFGDLHISNLSGSPTKMRIGCVVMLLNSYGMEQDIFRNTSKYGVRESTSLMDVLQERIFMIDHIAVILLDMQLLQELLYTGIQTSIFYLHIPSCLFLWI